MWKIMSRALPVRWTSNIYPTCGLPNALIKFLLISEEGGAKECMSLPPERVNILTQSSQVLRSNPDTLGFLHTKCSQSSQSPLLSLQPGVIEVSSDASTNVVTLLWLQDQASSTTPPKNYHLQLPSKHSPRPSSSVQALYKKEGHLGVITKPSAGLGCCSSPCSPACSSMQS